jgi:hypothetical protein
MVLAGVLKYQLAAPRLETLLPVVLPEQRSQSIQAKMTRWG